MATRTFLTPDQLTEAQRILQPPMALPTGRVEFDHSLTTALDFSSWLSLSVENRLRAVPGWEQASPIAIGSWGRGELCPGSDLDVIFCGAESDVLRVVDHIAKTGLKLRYRVPDDPNDWTQGVDILEANALFWAKALTRNGEEKLQEQKNKILKKQKSFRRKLLRTIGSERRERAKRYDSIANFLEPNLKFGAGGLRDMYQGRVLAHWFPDRFEFDEHSFKVLEYYKCFFLLIRQKLQLEHNRDILIAQDQQDLFRWLGYDSHLDFMVEVQKGLSRVSFHSDWIGERCGLTQKEFLVAEAREPKRWHEAFQLIKKDPSLQSQLTIRNRLYETKGFKSEKLEKKQKGDLLKKIIDIKQDPDVTNAAFRSQMVSHLVPNYTRVIGLVQHDQYHRFSVDAHLRQAVRQVKRMYDHPKLLGKLEYYSEKLSLSDWNILRWAALYHDIAKGQGGSHEKKGKELASKDLRSFGLNKNSVDEVSWLVENHLILSTAAFRKNPRSPHTWEFLYSRGCRGRRLYRLAIFTVIDIIATNPEAWNSWKENLLCDIVEILRKPEQEHYYDFSQKIKRRKLDVSESFISALDMSVVTNISERVLLNDFNEVLKGQDLKPLVVRGLKNQIWVRFHRNQDQPGLLLQFTQRLAAIGCNIRHASVMTDPKMGVYDWFCVKTSKSIPILKKQLLHNISLTPSFDCSFSSIALISEDKEEWVFSFRAKDKKGLLVTAIQSLSELGLEIIWATVNTWGRQIDDVFGVVPHKYENSKQILTKLKQNRQVEELVIM